MSLAHDLDIYKSARDLLTFSLKVQAHVPRAYRLAVGQRISNECADILLDVARANVSRGEIREAHIARLLERVEAARVIMHAAQQLRIIPLSMWTESVALTDSVGKQANGWRNQTLRNLAAAPAA